MPRQRVSLGYLLKVILKIATKLVVDSHVFTCPGCGLLPKEPVTVPCGQTYCRGCLENRTCDCRDFASEALGINLMIAEATAKMKDDYNRSRMPIRAQSDIQVLARRGRYRQGERISVFTSKSERYRHACRLFIKKLYFPSLAQFMCIAVTSNPLAKKAQSKARTILGQLVYIYKPRTIVGRTVSRVLHLNKVPWGLSGRDFKCVICIDIVSKPITLPCGHTFCKQCIYNNALYQECCPLCRKDCPLWMILKFKENLFMRELLWAIGDSEQPEKITSDKIPVLKCNVPMPLVPCPVLVIDPLLNLLVRYIINSKDKEFGIIIKDNSPTGCGTIMRVCDCVQLETGAFMMCTVGVGRFKILETFTVNWISMARISKVHDRQVYTHSTLLLQRSIETYHLGEAWFKSLSVETRENIISYYGVMPPIRQHCLNKTGFYSKEGPTWLWWLITVLPLSKHVQLMAHCTTSLFKRVHLIRSMLLHKEI